MLVLGRAQPVSQHSSRDSGRHLPVGIRQEMLERGSLDEDVCLQHPTPEKQASLFSCQVWPENPSIAQLLVPALRRPAGSQALCPRTEWVPGATGEEHQCLPSKPAPLPAHRSNLTLFCPYLPYRRGF